MTKYNDFIDAYRKAYPMMNPKAQYDRANTIWKDLKSNPGEFDVKFAKKMAELKLLRIQNNSQSLKSFTLNFGKIKVPGSQIKIKDQTVAPIPRYVEQKGD